jgi:antitoxin PrlF
VADAELHSRWRRKSRRLTLHLMSTLTMSSKGQLTVPRELREKLKLRPGCQVDVRVDEEGRLILTPVLYDPEEFLARRPPKPARVASIEEMEAGIRKGAARGRF